MTDYTYSRVAALNFNTVPTTVGRSATGSVYAIGDTTFTTPLNVTMVVGGTTGTSISSDANGFFPDFTVTNRTSVVFKQGGTSFTSVLTTTDPVPGAKGDTGAAGTPGAKGDRGDLASWQASTFYPLNQVISNPTGDLVKVTTAHTSGASYDATKFDYVVPPSLTPAALNATIDDQIEVAATAPGGVLPATFVRASAFGNIASEPDGSLFVINRDDVGWDLWAIFGQSNNGNGIGKDATYQDTPDPRIWQFANSSGAGLGYYRKMIQAVEPLFHQGSFASDQIGYAHRFVKSYLATVPANRRVLLVPCARASTGFQETAGYSWLPSNTTATTNLYNVGIAQIDAALAAAGPNSRVVGFLWHQGENDAGTATATYAGWLDSLIDAVHTKYGATIPFIIGQMLPDTYVARNEAGVHAAHAQTPGRKDYTAFVYGPYNAYNSDAQPPIHYNANGQRQLGDAYFQGYLRALSNHAGTDLASVPDAPVVTQSGGTPTAALARWTPAKGKVTDYVIEYSRNGGAWTTWAHTASSQADTAITGLAFGDTIKVRVKSVNANGTSAASAESNTITLQTLLDKTPTAWRAYGLRQLKSTAPYAIKVRRSSDNATQDIGFSGGLLNTTALLSFCGAGDGFVDTWYDQSGNGRNLTQATTTAQAQIVTAGAVNYLNNRPALRFAGAAFYESTTLGLYAAGAASMLATASITTAANGKAVVAESSTTTGSLYTHFALGSNLGQKMALTNDTPANVFNSTAASAFPANLQQVSTVDTGTVENGNRNGVAETPSTTYARSGVVTLDRFNVGAYYAGTGSLASYSFWNGYITELVLFTSALSTAQRAAGEADQRAYSGTDYPPAP